jgi:hypothetical protein
MVITGGCSFSDQFSNTSWIHLLKLKIQKKYPKVKFRHTGLSSQGQELIQKKISIALIEELEHYKPEEILVLPMWSGTERKTFWIDNTDVIEDIVSSYQRNEGSYFLQFHNLYSQTNEDDMKFSKTTKYNSKGGWYIANYHIKDSKISKEFFNLHKTIIGFATISLENIIFLQNLCKLKGVHILHSFFRNCVYDDIVENKDHLNLKYLFSMLDHDNIVSTTGIYEYLRPSIILSNERSTTNIMYKPFKEDSEFNRQYFADDNAHPNILGNTKWLNEVLIPKLHEKKLFKLIEEDVL